MVAHGQSDSLPHRNPNYTQGTYSVGQNVYAQDGRVAQLAKMEDIENNQKV